MITIGIASYNQEEYLPDAIESALSQEMEGKLEVIVVDDGSTDNSLGIAKSYEPGLKVISQVNKGLASARNTMIMNMTGEYLLPLDADDILMTNCIDEIQKVISKTNADIIAPSLKEFGIRNQEIIVMPNPTLEDFRTANRIGYFSAVKKSALLEVGGYSPRMTWGYEDYHLWINLLKRGKKLVTIPKPLVLYRTRERSMIHSALEHHDELIAQINKDFS